jgi:hypothetical protein
VKAHPMNQDYDDHDGRRGLIDDDEVLDFILYKEITKNDHKQRGGNGGCLGIIILLLLPVASVMIFCLKG